MDSPLGGGDHTGERKGNQQGKGAVSVTNPCKDEECGPMALEESIKFSA